MSQKRSKGERWKLRLRLNAQRLFGTHASLTRFVDTLHETQYTEWSVSPFLESFVSVRPTLSPSQANTHPA